MASELRTGLQQETHDELVGTGKLGPGAVEVYGNSNSNDHICNCLASHLSISPHFNPGCHTYMDDDDDHDQVRIIVKQDIDRKDSRKIGQTIVSRAGDGGRTKEDRGVDQSRYSYRPSAMLGERRISVISVNRHRGRRRKMRYRDWEATGHVEEEPPYRPI
jgi:hypothetical protein